MSDDALLADEPWTPVEIERRLRGAVTALTQAQHVLRDARDDEVTKRHAYEAARRQAMLRDPNCPKVTRGGYTTAERDAWVEDRVSEQRAAYDFAVAAREAAQDHLRVVRDQAEVLRSLGASIRTAFEFSGRAS